MKKRNLPKEGNRYRISIVVEKIVLEHYDSIKQIEMMRDVYYFVREKLDKILKNKKITQEEYTYFMDNYEGQFVQEWWPYWEKKHGIVRPITKDDTTVWWRNSLYESSDMDRIIKRARGFIFVEKSGMAKQLKPLTKYGFILLSGQGQATRILRERLKATEQGTEKRPIITICDYDEYGGIISSVFEDGSKRTSHLDLKFKNLIELGLTKEQADKYKLPYESYTDKKTGKTKQRVELNSFIYLKERYNLEQPFFTFVVNELQKHIRICELPAIWRELVTTQVSLDIELIFDKYIRNLVEKEVDIIIPEEEISIDVKYKNKWDNIKIFSEKKYFKQIEKPLQKTIKCLINNTRKVQEKEAEKDNLKELNLPNDTLKFIKQGGTKT